MEKKVNLSFFKDKTVLLTGHTGFKGSWMSQILVNAGANLIGYSLCRKKEESLFELIDARNKMISVQGDVRDIETLNRVFTEYQPEIVIHMAAQPIVRTSYEMPVYTYETNVMGTVNVLECIRKSNSVKSFLNVTTDKVYENKEWNWGYRENDILDGYDPYSNSKSCSELVTHSYKQSFFSNKECAISTARAGNVIGGGDFAKDRIIPDCVRAARDNELIHVRNPYSIRPYEHVLEPLYAYLLIIQSQYLDRTYEGCYNIGPEDCDCLSTGELVNLFCEKWGDGIKWQADCNVDAPHEANFLKLDCSKMKSTFGWAPRWHINTAVEKICEWSKIYLAGGDVMKCMNRQISDFFGEEYE